MGGKNIMYIETTGEIFIGKCEVQTDNCKAKKEGSVTKVLSPHESKSINVCNVCLTKMVQDRVWNIKGASVPEMKEIVDIAIILDGFIQLALEAKNWKEAGVNWAERMKDMAFDRMRKLNVAFFILATYEGFYIFDSFSAQPFFVDLSSDIEKGSNELKISYESLFISDANEFRLDPALVEKKHNNFVEILEYLLTMRTIVDKLPEHISKLIQHGNIKKKYIF